jgi:hypothetical protein
MFLYLFQGENVDMSQLADGNYLAANTPDRMQLLPWQCEQST